MKDQQGIKTGTAIFLALCILTFGAIYLFARSPGSKPVLKGATPAQIRAVLPPELLETTPIDPDAVTRFTTVMSLLKGIDLKPYEPAFQKDPNPAAVAKLAAEFKSTQASTLAGIDSTLSEGPIQQARRFKDGMASFTGMMDVKADVKLFTAFGKSLADSGDATAGTNMLIISIKLSDACLHCKGDVITYLTAVASEAICFSAIQNTIANPRFPASECARLLAAIPASSRADEDLRLALRSEFQDTLLSKLSDPKYMAALARAMADPSFTGDKAVDTPIGTYDALQTASLAGALNVEALKNTGKPYSEIDQREFNLIHEDAAKLPQSVDDSETRGDGDGDGSAYRTAMSTGENTIGRVVLAATAKERYIFAGSCRIAARRDCTRVDLAAAIYRSAHGGTLPTSSDRFKSLLGSWPNDPFNGKPMLYDSKKQAVYSVGSNLKDDGGNFTKTTSGSLDEGASLRRN